MLYMVRSQKSGNGNLYELQIDSIDDLAGGASLATQNVGNIVCSAGSEARNVDDTLKLRLNNSGAWVILTGSPVLLYADSISDIQTVEGAVEGVLTVRGIIKGTPVYQWYSNTVKSVEGGTLITGATESIYTLPVNLAEGTQYYYCAVTVGETTAKTNVATVTVATAP